MSEIPHSLNRPENEEFAQNMVDFYNLNLEMARRFDFGREDQNPQDLAEFARFYAHKDAPKSPWDAVDELTAGNMELWGHTFTSFINEADQPKITFAQIISELDEVRKPFHIKHAFTHAFERVADPTKGDIDHEAIEMDRYDITKEEDLYDELASKLALSGLTEVGVINSLNAFNKKMKLDDDMLVDILDKVTIIRDEAEMAAQVLALEIDNFMDSNNTKAFLTEFEEEIAKYLKEKGNLNGFYGYDNVLSPIGQRIQSEARRIVGEFAPDDQTMRDKLGVALNTSADKILAHQLDLLKNPPAPITKLNEKPNVLNDKSEVDESKKETKEQKVARYREYVKSAVRGYIAKYGEEDPKKAFEYIYKDQLKRSKLKTVDFEENAMGIALKQELVQDIADDLGFSSDDLTKDTNKLEKLKQEVSISMERLRPKPLRRHLRTIGKTALRKARR